MPTAGTKMKRRLIGTGVPLFIVGLLPAIGCHLPHEDACDGNGCPPGYTDCESDVCHPLYCLPTWHYLRCVDEKVTIHEAADRANLALQRDYPVAPSAHFCDGFGTAFVDIALGAHGEIPPVPPRRYWKLCYRTENGHAIAQEWFAGYAAGAARALSSRRAHDNNVASSGQTEFSTDPTPNTIQLDEAEGLQFGTGW